MPLAAACYTSIQAPHENINVGLPFYEPGSVILQYFGYVAKYNETYEKAEWVALIQSSEAKPVSSFSSQSILPSSSSCSRPRQRQVEKRAEKTFSYFDLTKSRILYPLTNRPCSLFFYLTAHNFTEAVKGEVRR